MHNAIILHDLIPKLKAPLRGRRFHIREDAVQGEITRLDNGQSNGAADGTGRFPHRYQRTVLEITSKDVDVLKMC
ncbi:hypothetical protein C0J52_26133 [Blattella germanica]|nr:hypothetical protein C0J52_26133 [Blattella germanica]